MNMNLITENQLSNTGIWIINSITTMPSERDGVIYDNVIKTVDYTFTCAIESASSTQQGTINLLEASFDGFIELGATTPINIIDWVKSADPTLEGRLYTECAKDLTKQLYDTKVKYTWNEETQSWDLVVE